MKLKAYVFVSAALFCGAMSCGNNDEDQPVARSSTTPGPLMRPGWNCNATGCHFPLGQTKPPPWSAGGTVFLDRKSDPSEGVKGAVVTLTDEEGKEVSLTTNEAGNFYTLEKLVGPLRVSLSYEGRTIRMPGKAPAGSCNFCHQPLGDAQGRIFLPPK
jgi:hypothetical protein